MMIMPNSNDAEISNSIMIAKSDAGETAGGVDASRQHISCVQLCKL